LQIIWICVNFTRSLRVGEPELRSDGGNTHDRREELRKKTPDAGEVVVRSVPFLSWKINERCRMTRSDRADARLRFVGEGHRLA
jgi:hypothetical protein